LLSFLGKSGFDDSQPSLQVLHSRLCGGSFALFLLECSVLRPFGSTLVFCFCVNHTLRIGLHRCPPSFDSNPLESMQSRHNQLPTSDEPDPAANSSRARPGYSCFLVPEMPPVQRRTSAACASIILCALSCQSCTRSLPDCAPAPGSGLKLRC